MGMRPPPADDGNGGAESVDFGIAALAAHLDGADLSFPATADEVAAALDDPEVAYDPHGNTVALSTALDRVDRERFDSESDIHDALHPVFEEYRTSTGTGVVAWLRARLPF